LLIQQASDKIKISKKSRVGVWYTVEWALWYRYRGLRDITIMVKRHCNLTKKFCDQWGFSYIIVNKKEISKLKKFDIVVGNPPYLQGTWRTFMQQALDLSNRYVVMVAPDGTIRTSTKFDDMKKMLEDGGVQSVTPCHEHFPGVTTSSEISWYVFDKTLPSNAFVFNKNLSNDQLLTLSIVDKVKKIKIQNTGLTQSMSAGKKDKLAQGTVSTITNVTKNGVTATILNRSSTKVINNSSDYFFVNKFFGMNPDDNVYETSGPVGVVDDNIYYIGRPNGMTQAEFKRIYFHKLMRFVLKYYRGTNRRTLGWSIRELPIVPNNTTDLYQYFGLTNDEIAHVESSIS
jgi:hypothetical protein